MSQSQDLIFEEPKSNHIQAIVNIHNSNIRSQSGSNDRGFLLAQTTEEEIFKHLTDSNQYFIAVNSVADVMGFLAISKPKINDDFLTQMIWQNNNAKDKIISNQERHIYIKIVATKREYMGQGVAQFMYKSLYEKFPNSLLSSFIVTKPILNNRSLVFHEKQGFKQIGAFQRQQFLDLQNYESVLMFKEL